MRWKGRRKAGKKKEKEREDHRRSIPSEVKVESDLIRHAPGEKERKGNSPVILSLPIEGKKKHRELRVRTGGKVEQELIEYGELREKSRTIGKRAMRRKTAPRSP